MIPVTCVEDVAEILEKRNVSAAILSKEVIQFQIHEISYFVRIGNPLSQLYIMNGAVSPFIYFDTIALVDDLPLVKGWCLEFRCSRNEAYLGLTIPLEGCHERTRFAFC